MEDTSGFYKQNADGTWLFAKEEVVAPNYELSREDYESLEVSSKSTNQASWKWYREAPQEFIDWQTSEAEKLKNLE
jgi:hypothetical protein